MAITLFYGCEQAAEFAADATQQIQQAAPNPTVEVKPAASLSNRIDLQIERLTQINSCHVSFIRIAGRPAVLQVASYNTPAAESFPSFFLRALTEQTEPTALQGSHLAAEIFVQETPEGPIWHSDENQPAQIVITALDTQSITAQLQGVLTNSATGASKEFVGKLNGSLRLVQ